MIVRAFRGRLSSLAQRIRQAPVARRCLSSTLCAVAFPFQFPPSYAAPCAQVSSPAIAVKTYSTEAPAHLNWATKDRATTVLCVRKSGDVVVMADGQVTRGKAVVKSNIRKVHKIQDGRVLVGFAGGAADAIALMERLEGKLGQYPELKRACVELAKEWRLDRAMRNLDALMIAADTRDTFMVSGSGEVIESADGVIGIGSGGNFAIAAARALYPVEGLSAFEIAQRSMTVAAEICIYTNKNFVHETLSANSSAQPSSGAANASDTSSASADTKPPTDAPSTGPPGNHFP